MKYSLMKKIIIFLTVFFLILLPLFSQNKIITAAANPYPPFIDSNNPTDGLSLEIIRAAYKNQGYIVEMEYVPWARAINGVTLGEYDILPDVWYSVSRSEVMLYSQPYALNQIKFISTKDISFEYNGMDSLKGKTIGVIRGYFYNQEFEDSKDFKKENVGGFIQNILKLILGRIELTLEDEIVAKAALLQENPELLEKIHFSSTPLSSNEIYITCGYKNPRHIEIISVFNRGLLEIKSNGIYAEIMGKYGM